ncbi:MAG: DUF1559 domain-containing protein [Fuerstiella sp.]
MLRSIKPQRAGFTVIELLVSLSIIALLLALVVPAVQQSRAAADLMLCKNRMKQVGLAAHNFHDAKRHFPHRAAYMARLLPYLEQGNLYDAMEPYRVPTGGTYLGVPDGLGAVTVLACPSSDVDLNRYEISYVVNAGHRLARTFESDWGEANGMLVSDYNSYEPIRISDVRDGTSNTAFISEERTSRRHDKNDTDFLQASRKPASANEFRDLCLNSQEAVSHKRQPAVIYGGDFYQHVNLPNEQSCFWDGPALDTTSSRPPTSWHSGGVNVLLVDGSVRFVANEIDELAWRELGSRNSDIEPTELWDN